MNYHLVLDGNPLCIHENYFWLYGCCHYGSKTDAETGVKQILRRYCKLNISIVEGPCPATKYYLAK